jgi:hypothetical protein
VVFNAASVAASDVEALSSIVLTAATDAIRMAISLARVVESMPFTVVNAVATPANELDTDTMDALRVLTSVVKAAEMPLSTTASDDTAALNAAETEVIALVRLITSADSALEVVVMSAITVAICAKLGLVMISDAISASVSRLEGALPFMLDNAVFKALLAADVSAPSAVEIFDATVVNDGSVTLKPAEMDPTWLMRKFVSVEMAPLKLVFKFTRPVTVPTAETDKDETALTRVDVSAKIAELRLEFTEVSVDAAELVEKDNEDTALLSVDDSATNAADMV